MQLMTPEIEKKLKDYPISSQSDKGFDALVLVTFFNPYGAGTWLITEGEKQEDGDWLLYGYCHINEWEWGSVSLKELESYSDPRYHLGIEHDLYLYDGLRVRDLVEVD